MSANSTLPALDNFPDVLASLTITEHNPSTTTSSAPSDTTAAKAPLLSPSAPVVRAVWRPGPSILRGHDLGLSLEDVAVEARFEEKGTVVIRASVGVRLRSRT